MLVEEKPVSTQRIDMSESWTAIIVEGPMHPAAPVETEYVAQEPNRSVKIAHEHL